MSLGATIVVQFGEGADSSAFVTMELDETLNLDSAGDAKSEFGPGDEVWFWLQHDTNLAVERIESTSGMVVDCGMARRERNQELTFIGEEGASLSYIPAVSPTFTWFGNVGAGLGLDGRSVTVAGNLPCTCDVVIPIDVHLYRFIPPALELAEGASYRVVVVVTMGAVT